MIFDSAYRSALSALADAGVYVGTSSWKYEGWLDQFYARDRYIFRGKFARSRFNRNCLAEFAETFKTVCVDAAYYAFPTETSLREMAAQTPGDFRFAFKVTDEITVKRFPNLVRFGAHAGRPNPYFLDAERFKELFLKPCEAIRAKVGLLIFEFSKFASSEFAFGRDFVAALEEFLGRLPREWPYGVEIRNRSFLHPNYFAALARHEACHVFNSWSGMPPIGEQIALPGSFPSANFGARLLLRPGRGYEEAVARFSPYNSIQDPYPEGVSAAVALVRKAKSMGKRGKGFIYVNNRFEGNALQTIASILQQSELTGLEKTEAGA